MTNQDALLEELTKTLAFQDISVDELKSMMEAGILRQHKYHKNTMIFKAGEVTEELGLVLKGNVLVENVDYWGSKSILSSVMPGKVFGETYALSGHKLLVDARALETSIVYLLNVQRILNDDITMYSWHDQMMKNLLRLSSRRGLTLSVHIFYTTPKKVRDRISLYLSGLSSSVGSTEFDIPFNREQMADYLNVDRSALSKELGLMQKEGLIEFRKNHFKLLDLIVEEGAET